MKEADSNSDGMISLEEFNGIMNELKNTNNTILFEHLDGQTPESVAVD